MKRAIGLSLVDQAVLSAQSLILTFFLIRTGDAEALGHFALAMSVYFLFVATQNALIGAPLLTKVFGRPAAEQKSTLHDVCTFNALLLGVSSVLGAIMLACIGFAAVDVAAGFVMILSGLLRENTRTISASTGGSKKYFLVDLTSVVTSLVVVWFLSGVVAPELACLICLAAGNIVAMVLFRPALYINFGGVSHAIAVYRDYFVWTRWSLLASISGELQICGFLFVIEMVRGLSSAGVIQAGRFLVSPVALVGMAWGRVALPRVSAHFRNNAPERALEIVIGSMICLSAFALAYFAALYLAWDWLERMFFQGKYPEIGGVVAGWCSFTLAIELVRCLSWTFEARGKFRDLATLAAPFAVGAVLSMFVMTFSLPLGMALVILTACHVAFGALLAWRIPARSRLAEAPA